DMDVVASDLQVDTKLPELIRDKAELVDSAILDGDLALGHSRKADKRADLDHIRQHPVRGAPEIGYALDMQQVAADARYPGAHAGQHLAKLLDIGLTGGVVDGGDA